MLKCVPRLILFFCFVCSFSLIAVHAAWSAEPFPSESLPGISVGDNNLPSGYEPSGIVWHSRVQKLFLVSDGGIVSSMNTDGTGVSNWYPGGDLEGIAIAQPQSSLIYLGIEHPDSISEFNITTGMVTRTFDLRSWMTGPDNSGLEALTFVPDANDAEGGLFYAGLQDTGQIFVFRLPILSSTTSTAVTYIRTIPALNNINDISGLHYEISQDVLYAIYDSANLLRAMEPNGTLIKEWNLPGVDQEGITLKGTELYIAHDTGGVYMYSPFAVFPSSNSTVFDKYKIKILPLGDSITHTSSSYYSYRYNLWKKLIDHDISFDFVGSMNTNFGGNPDWPQYKGLSFDQDHEGHYGWRAEELLYGRSTNPELGNLTDWLGVYTPDIVLLHIGTNDLGSGQSYTSTANEIKLIIDTIRLDNPDVTILLAKLIPRDYTYNNIIAFNQYIEPIAQEKGLPNSPVIVVDQWTGFDYATDTYDGTHPNASGEEKMAEKWMQALLPCLKNFDGNINLDDKVDSEDLAYIADSWAAELSANLYFGDNFSDINSADTSSQTYVGNFTTNSYLPGTLVTDSTYYWRIDEIDANGPHKGNTWQFTTGANDTSIGWWKLDKSTEDLSSYGNDGIALGQPTTVDDPNWAKCISFDGDNDYIQIPNESAFDLTTHITIAAWIRLATEEDGIYTIISKGNSFWFYLDAYAHVITFYCEGLERPVKSSINVFDGKWHHITAVYDGAERAIYVDGIKDASRSSTASMVLNGDYLLIGNNELSLDESKFNGEIREVRIYSSRLSDDMILSLSKTNNYSPRPFNGQDNVRCDTALIFSPEQWMRNITGDLNDDFVVDFKDVAMYANNWFENFVH